MQSLLAGVRMLAADGQPEEGVERTPDTFVDERKKLLRRIADLERTIEKQDHFVNEQEAKLGKLNNENARLNHELGQREHRQKLLESANKRYIQDIRQEVKKSKDMEVSLNRWRIENGRLDQAFKNQKTAVQDLEIHNAELEKRLKGQQDTVDRAQKAGMAIFTRDVSNHMPDDRVRKLFGEHFARISRWARDNAAGPFEPKNQLPPDLRKVTVVERWPAYLSFDLRTRSAPSTLLEAALSYELVLRIFGHPFFLAGTKTPFFDPETREGPAAGDSLLSIHNEILKEDEAAAYCWRAKTVETLNSNITSDIKAKYFHDFVEHFLRVYQLLIRADVLEESKIHLQKICAEFGEFALQLWSLNSTISCYGVDHFSNFPFDVDSDEMDFAKTVQLEEHDTSLNGRPIPLVVQPLIVGHGSVEGRNYELRKIWSKAVVWVSSKPEPEPAPSIAITEGADPPRSSAH